DSTAELWIMAAIDLNAIVRADLCVDHISPDPGPVGQHPIASAAQTSPSIRCVAGEQQPRYVASQKNRARRLKCPIGLWSPFYWGRGRGRRRGPRGCARMGEQSDGTQRGQAGSVQDPPPALDALFSVARDG